MNIYTVVRAEHPRCIHCKRKMESWFFNQDESTMECDPCWRARVTREMAAVIHQSFSFILPTPHEPRPAPENRPGHLIP